MNPEVAELPSNLFAFRSPKGGLLSPGGGGGGVEERRGKRRGGGGVE